jgi:hypothetical protein
MIFMSGKSAGCLTGEEIWQEAVPEAPSLAVDQVPKTLTTKRPPAV